MSFNLTQGKFITFEGIDGAGKSSHIQAAEKWLQSKGVEVICTREPGGTPLGEKLRALLLSEKMHVDAEALLMFAARSQHVQELILPALKRGVWVVSDRFTDASFAYQAAAGGCDWHRLEILENWVLQDFKPDLTVLFDLSPHQAAQRMAERQVFDKFENQPINFQENVRNGYWRRHKENAIRFECIDASQTIDQVSVLLQTILEKRWTQWMR